jgi:hypothetical protein
MGAAAGAARAVREEAADGPPGPGRRAPMNSGADSSQPHNLIKNQNFFTKILPQHYIDTPNTFTKPKS